MFWGWSEARRVAGLADPAAGAERSGGRSLPCRTPPPGRYGRLHARFLRLAGGEAEAAQEAALVMLLRPGLRMLDAGCGPGTIARRLMAHEAGIDLTMVDTDPWMLAQCRDIGGRRLQGSLEHLPLPDGSVDVAFAFWSLETLADPSAGLRELVRVTRPGGWVAITFCARGGANDWLDLCVWLGIAVRRSGRMLSPDRVRRDLALAGGDEIRQLHCRGPAQALIARSVCRQTQQSLRRSKPRSGTCDGLLFCCGHK